MTSEYTVYLSLNWKSYITYPGNVSKLGVNGVNVCRRQSEERESQVNLLISTYQVRIVVFPLRNVVRCSSPRSPRAVIDHSSRPLWDCRALV